MKIALYCLLAMLALGLIFPVPGPGAPPKTLTLEGCVIKGVFYAVHKKSGSTIKPPAGFQRVHFDDADLSPFEGKRIRISGSYAADGQFLLNPKTLKVLGACNRETRDAIPSGR
jgi:hypothetical protein